MRHIHEPIMYPMKNIFENNESPHQFFFKSGKAEINQAQKYSNPLYKYFYAEHARDIA